MIEAGQSRSLSCTLYSGCQSLPDNIGFRFDNVHGAPGHAFWVPPCVRPLVKLTSGCAIFHMVPIALANILLLKFGTTWYTYDMHATGNTIAVRGKPTQLTGKPVPKRRTWKTARLIMFGFLQVSTQFCARE